MTIWYLFVLIWYIFPQFWYHVPRKNLATLRSMKTGKILNCRSVFRKNGSIFRKKTDPFFDARVNSALGTFTTYLMLQSMLSIVYIIWTAVQCHWDEVSDLSLIT
jgi:hypothetical protein